MYSGTFKTDLPLGTQLRDRDGTPIWELRLCDGEKRFKHCIDGGWDSADGTHNKQDYISYNWNVYIPKEAIIKRLLNKIDENTP